MKNINKKKGFTLIEILVVIGIIAILATIVLIAINPARQFRQANDTQRTSNVNAILNAVGQFMADNKGQLPTGIPSGDPEVEAEYDEITDAAGGANICDDLVPTYIPSLPVDPTGGDDSPVSDCSVSYETGYHIIEDDDGRVTVLATHTEEAADDISVTR